MNNQIAQTPWDQKAFQLDTFELQAYDESTLNEIKNQPGHYTIKVDPLLSKQLIHEHGFYYCDTLIEPHCSKDQFISHPHESVSISKDVEVDHFISLAKGSWEYGRFHRDFHIQKDQADQRYANWLRDIAKKGECLSLLWEGQVVGFFACENEKILLHALCDEIRGKGYAKYLWTEACTELYKEYDELTSSISAANCAAVNVYVSCGFKFRNSLDVYHKFIA